MRLQQQVFSNNDSYLQAPLYCNNPSRDWGVLTAFGYVLPLVSFSPVLSLVKAFHLPRVFLEPEDRETGRLPKRHPPKRRETMRPYLVILNTRRKRRDHIGILLPLYDSTKQLCTQQRGLSFPCRLSDLSEDRMFPLHLA